MNRLSKNVFIGIYLDSRGKKKGNKCPVKLSVYYNLTGKTKYFLTAFDLTEDEFKSVWHSDNPRGNNKIVRNKLECLVASAKDVAYSLPVFNIDDFKRIMYGTAGSKELNVNYYYSKAIDHYNKNGKIKTAGNYEQSLKSLMDFYDKSSLSFEIITLEWLRKYEDHMINDLGNSSTTVGFYLRPLRAIFNTAIEEKVISEMIYPFGRRRYKISATKNNKTALEHDQLKTLWLSQPTNVFQQRAKDFWFFSYGLGGMNLKDIAQLKYGNIKNDFIVIRRGKSKDSKNTDLEISLPITAHLEHVIKKYGREANDKNTLIFEIIQDLSLNIKEQQRQIDNFVRFINQHIGLLAKSVGIKENISTKVARHTFATQVIRSGGSIAFAGESMGHTNPKTTLGYFNGFDKSHKKSVMEKLFVL